MKALTKRIFLLAGRRDSTPPSLDNPFIDEPGMKAAIERAEAAMAEKDWGRATALWREVLGEFGDHAPQKAYLRLSQALRHDGQDIAAQAAMLEGLRRDPEDHRLRLELAVRRAEVASAEQDWGKATALWREVLEQFGDGAPQKAHLRLSQALRRDGQVPGAQATLVEGLIRDPDDHRLRRELAELATSKADWERVAGLWEDVLGSASTPTPAIVNGLAGALCELGRFREADEVLRRALAAGIDPGDIQSVFDSDVLRTQFLGRFGQKARGTVERREGRVEWYRVAVGARRLRDTSGLNAAITAPSAIWVSEWGRWGNSVRQLVNAVNVAEGLTVPRVYIPPTWYLEGDDPIYFGGHQVIQSDAPSPKERLVLRGGFTSLGGLKTILSETGKRRMRLAELRPFTVFRDREPLREDDLVIHIRAGDVFQKGLVHPGYGQPPLAYYVTVLRQRRWRSVHLVYENDDNPVIEPLLDHLRAEGIEPRTVVTDLASTVEFLLRAKTIVAGKGSFIPTIAELSSNLHLLYTFEGTPRRAVPPGVARIDVIDDRGDYRRAVMSGNWENRPDQVELMLHYPESALRVVPGSTAPRSAVGRGVSG